MGSAVRPAARHFSKPRDRPKVRIICGWSPPDTLLPTLQPVSIGQFSKQVLVNAARVSRGISQLEKKGFVTRQRSPEDNREMLVLLAPAGMEPIIEMCRASLETNEELPEGHTAAEARVLNEALDPLIERVRHLVAQDVASEASPIGTG
jgi:DNA-binding MarR family transcriptional regulator